MCSLRLMLNAALCVCCLHVQYISEPGGLKRLYAGIQPFLIGTVVSQGLYFYLYATLRGWVVVRQPTYTYLSSIRLPDAQTNSQTQVTTHSTT